MSRHYPATPLHRLRTSVIPVAKKLVALLVPMIASVVTCHSQTATTPSTPAAPGSLPAGFHDVVHFKNGDKLTGRLFSMTPGAQLEWHSPYYNQLIRFPFETVNTIAFLRPDPALVVPDADKTAVLLTNDDLIIGKLVALDDKVLTLAVPYAKPIVIRRSTIKSIYARITSTGSMYYGPKPNDKWERYYPHGQPWRVENKKLVSVPGASIVNNIPIGSDFRIQFDVSWNQIPAFWIGVGRSDNPNQASPAIQVMINANSLQISETPQLGNNQSRFLGNVTAMDLQNKSQARIALVVSSAPKSLTLLINEIEVHKFELSAILPAKSTGIVFGSLGAPQIEIQNIAVLSMVTDPDSKAPKQADSEKTDISIMSNNDTVPGDVLSIQNDLVTVKTSRGELNFPIDRIRAIALKPTGQERARLRPTDVRLWTDGFDHITLSLERIDAQGITGISENFGRVTFLRGAFNRIGFQIHDISNKQPK